MTDNRKAEVRAILQEILNELERETSQVYRESLLRYIDRATAEIGGLQNTKQETNHE